MMPATDPAADPAPDGFPGALLQQPAAARLAYFKDYTVAHPALRAADEALSRALREPAGASLLFLVGPTGRGQDDAPTSAQAAPHRRGLDRAGPGP